MGTLALPFSGLWLAADDNQMPMKIVVFYNGLVSGYPLGVTPT
jgi:hypothetical protein